MHCPQAKRICLVQDNLNTHDGASLYDTFSPAEGRAGSGQASNFITHPSTAVG